MNTFRFAPIKGELARRITPVKIYTDEYYANKEKELLAMTPQQLNAKWNSQLLKIEDWKAKRDAAWRLSMHP